METPQHFYSIGHIKSGRVGFLCLTRLARKGTISREKKKQKKTKNRRNTMLFWIVWVLRVCIVDLRAVIRNFHLGPCKIENCQTLSQ